MGKGKLLVCAALALAACAGPMRPDRSLLAEIAKIRAIDHHAHPDALTPVASGEPEPASLVAESPSSMPARMRVDNGEWLQAWKALWGYPHRTRTADQLRALWRQKRARQLELGERYPAWVLDQAGVETVYSVLPGLGTGLAGTPRFRWIPIAGDLISPFGEAAARVLADSGAKAVPASFDAYLRDLVIPLLAGWKGQGAIAIKFGTAYRRPLDFAEAPEADAKRLFAEAHKGAALAPADQKLVQDALFFAVAREAGKVGLAVHIHTGVGSDPYFQVSGSVPTLLEPAFNHPSVRQTTFVMVHGGWPYEREAGAMLIKPNVYLDFSGQTFLRSRRALASTLRAWLEWYPEKILFGSDAYSDGSTPLANWEEKLWLATHTTRYALALALTEMIADRQITRARALELATLVLRDNALRLYGAPGDGKLAAPPPPAPQATAP